MIDAALYEQYSKKEIDIALELLNYKNVSVLPKFESSTQPTIYIFRHGQTEDNADFIFSGWRDSPLTEKGREQAKTLAEKLKSKKIDLLISSPQIRAIETMKIAMSLNPAKGLEILKDPRIKERSYGVLQGKSKLEIQLKDPEELKKIRRSYDYKVQEGESLAMVIERVFDFCNEILPLAKKNKLNIAVSCHGNSIRGFRKYFEKLPNDIVAELETPLAQDYASYIIE